MWLTAGSISVQILHARAYTHEHQMGALSIFQHRQ